MLPQNDRQQDPHRRWARRAQQVAIASWALAAVAPGSAAALAQYASLADVDAAGFNLVAVLIVCLGVGAALLGWGFWATVHYRLHRAGYRAPARAMPAFPALFAFLFWIAMLVGGAAVTGRSGSSDSIAPLVLLAFGLGIAAAIAGVLGLIKWTVRLQAQSSAASRALHAELRAAAQREGRAIQDPPALQLALGVLGVIVGVGVLLTSAGSMAVVAQTLHLPLLTGVLIVLAVGALLLFPSFWFLIVTAAGEHTLFPLPNVRGYAFRAATAVTMALLLVSIFEVVGLGILSFLPFLALGFLSQRMRARYWPPGVP